MGEAILSRLINQKIYQPDQVLVSDPQASRREALQQQYGVQTTFDNQAAASAEVLLLAIKPQAFEKVVADLSGNQDTLVLSILAGMPLIRLEAGFPGQAVIRTMPNTPATVGAGMSAIAPGKLALPQHIETAKTIFSAVGEVVEVPESAMDAVTGLSGSGPAFVALMVEALADGGVAAGLPRTVALQLAIQTVLGTAQLLQETRLHPGQLKDQVTSPGGTTIAGVTQLEKGAFRATVIEAVMAAYQRSQSLGS
jgi:pyrroline-5-carboxylate reductase